MTPPKMRSKKDRLEDESLNGDVLFRTLPDDKSAKPRSGTAQKILDRISILLIAASVASLLLDPHTIRPYGLAALSACFMWAADTVDIKARLIERGILRRLMSAAALVAAAVLMVMGRSVQVLS